MLLSRNHHEHEPRKIPETAETPAYFPVETSNPISRLAKIAMNGRIVSGLAIVRRKMDKYTLMNPWLELLLDGLYSKVVVGVW